MISKIGCRPRQPAAKCIALQRHEKTIGKGYVPISSEDVLPARHKKCLTLLPTHSSPIVDLLVCSLPFSLALVSRRAHLKPPPPPD